MATSLTVPFCATCAVALSVFTILSSLSHKQRNLTTISHEGIDYTLEVSHPISPLPSFFPHRHEIKQVFPATERANARVYFELRPCGFFDEYSFIPNQLDFHGHGGQVEMFNPKPGVYYVGKDWQIYDYDLDRPFSQTRPHLLHAHTITLISKPNTKTQDASETPITKAPLHASKKGTCKSKHRSKHHAAIHA